MGRRKARPGMRKEMAEMRLFNLRPMLCFVLSVGFFALAGCGGGKEFSAADFKKVNKTMKEDKILELLGPPTDSIDAGEQKWRGWKVKDDYYTVTIMKGAAAATQGPMKKDAYDAAIEFQKRMRSGPPCR